MSSTDGGQKTLNVTGALVAVLLVIILGCGIAALLKLDLPPNNHDVLLVLITTVANNVTNIIQFFYGSTANAKAKDDTISTLSSTAASAQAVITGNATPPDKIIPIKANETVAVHAGADAKPTEPTL